MAHTKLYDVVGSWTPFETGRRKVAQPRTRNASASVLRPIVTDELPNIAGTSKFYHVHVDLERLRGALWQVDSPLRLQPRPRAVPGPDRAPRRCLTVDPSGNAMVMHSLNNFPRLISGENVTILVNGHFEHDANGLPTEAGLNAETLALLKARKTNFVYPAITAFEPTAVGHTILFSTGTSRDASGTLFAPPIRANDMSGLATPPKCILDSPTDLVPGVFVAGNAKTQYSSVSAAEAGGVLTLAMGAARELGAEDAAADVEVAAESA